MTVFWMIHKVQNSSKVHAWLPEREREKVTQKMKSAAWLEDRQYPNRNPEPISRASIAENDNNSINSRRNK